MKSNRILQIVLVMIIIIFAVVAGYLYFGNANDSKKPTQLKADISRNQAILTKGLADQAAKQKEATTLASQLANAKTLMAKVSFRSSAQSIEYDRILSGIADNAKLQLTNITAGDAAEQKEGQNSYLVSIFTINLEAKTPETIFATPADSTAYINTNVSNILACLNQLATGTDFDTTIIQSVSITAPTPMTIQQIADKINGLKAIIKSQLKDSEITGLTDDQVNAVVDAKYAALGKEDIQRLLQLDGFDKPSAVITIQIWTYKKGA